MQTAPQISFRNIDPSDAVEDHVRRRIAELEEVYPRIISCEVVIEAPQKRKVSGREFTVRLKLGVPGRDIETSREVGRSGAAEDVNIAIHEAFDAARRILQDQDARLDPQHTKHHPPVVHGRIDRLFEGEGYGFIVADDGQEVYFERDNLTRDCWNELKVDARLRFRVEEGDKGPYAMKVTPLD